MMDDVAGISESESGIKAKQLNAFINVKAAENGLNFGPDKCHKMNITRNKAQIVSNDLFIDHWSENHNNEDQMIDTSEGK